MLSFAANRASAALLITLLLLLIAAVPSASGKADEVKVRVYSGPTECRNSSDSEKPLTKVEKDFVVSFHFTASVDETSEAGNRGERIESSHDRGVAPSVQIGQGKVIAGLDRGMIGLCKGSKAYIVVPPHLAYGKTGMPANNVPGGVTLRYDVEIVDVRRPAPNDFIKIDTDKDGKLTKEEAGEYFAKKGQRIDIDALFDSEDKDGDGTVSWEEFTGPKGDGPPDYLVQKMKREEMKMRQAQQREQQRQQKKQQRRQQTPPPSDPQQQLAEAFRAIDRDGDGKISKEELGAMFAAYGSEMTDEFWIESDVDGDGYVSFAEFITDTKKKNGGTEEL